MALKKRIIIIFLITLMIVTYMPALARHNAAALSAHTQAEAVEWAKGMADSHWAIRDGSHKTQCVEFIQQYYYWLLGYSVQGDGCDYLGDTYGACPYDAGWSRPATDTVQPGDIVVWDKHTNFRSDGTDYCLDAGHIGVVISVDGNTMVTVEANAGEDYGDEKGVCGYKYNREVSCISGLIRPDFKCKVHKWDSGIVTKKSIHSKDVLSDGEKTYTCIECGETKTETIKVSHSYKTTGTKAATLKKNGTVRKKCTECGKTKTETVYRPKMFKLRKTSITYTGKSLKPGVLIKDIKGKTIAKKYYSVSYSGNKNVGTAKVIIKFKGRYSGTKKLSFKIKPKGAAITKITTGSTGAKVTWKKKGSVTGYQLQYSSNKAFSNAKTITVKNSKKLSKKISGLAIETTYYFRIRTYKTVRNKKYYSAWSETIKKKTKSYSTEGGTVYDCVKVGNVVYCPMQGKIYKVNIKTGKKSLFIKSNAGSAESLSVHKGYLYYIRDYWLDDDHGESPMELCRTSLSTGKTSVVANAIDYYISGNRIYFSAYTSEYTGTYYGHDSYEHEVENWKVMNIDGTGEEYLGWFGWDYKGKHKPCNKSGYSIYKKDTDYGETAKVYLKKPNKKKIYLGKEDQLMGVPHIWLDESGYYW